MAESTIITCDYDGKPAVTTVNLRFNGGKETWQIDVCSTHQSELKSKARKARRGRRTGAYVAQMPGKPGKKEEEA